MTDEATYQEGYRRALEEISRFVLRMRDGHMTELADLLEEIDRRIERARCLGFSALASQATGKTGF